MGRYCSYLAASLLDSGVQRMSMIVRQEQSFGTRNYVGPYHILQLRQQPVKGRRAMGEPILSQILSKFGRIRLVDGDGDGAVADADVGGGKRNVEGGGRPVTAGTAVFPLAVPKHV